MTVQDAGVREPRARLRRVLSLLRLLGGRRGVASVTWHGAGYTYTLWAVREPNADPTIVDVDADETDDDLLGAARDVEDLRARLAELLEVQP
jgi:hypothetical protein